MGRFLSIKSLDRFGSSSEKCRGGRGRGMRSFRHLPAAFWAAAGVVVVFSGPAGAQEVDFFGLVPDPLRDERSSPWFGSFNDEHFSHVEGEGWIRHHEHGWVHVSGRGYGQGFWMWDHIWQRWWWTQRDVYPFLFGHEDGDWRYYERGGEPAGRAFFSYDDGNPGDWSEVGFFGLIPDPFGEDEEAFWFGEFDDGEFDHVEKRGWIEHDEHGRIFVSGKNYEHGFWLWDEILEEWLWTRAASYPFLYSDEREGWLFYRRGGQPGSREFFDYGAGEEGAWITVAP